MINSIIIILIVVLDQWSKWLAVTKLKMIDTYPLIQDVFHLTYRENTGAAFSMLSGNMLFLIGASSLVLVLLIVFLIYEKKNNSIDLAQIALTLMIGGAIGNLIDRIRLGYVIDYFDFNLINFAVFNVADVFVVVGAFLFGFHTIFLDNKERGNQK